MAAISPGSKLWDTYTPLTVANSPLVTGWLDTDGFTNIVLAYVFTNSTGTTVMTVEGSNDEITLESTHAYAALAASPQTALLVPVMHDYIRFRIVQTTADATVTSVFAQASRS
jgi:hypothetical protein